MPVNAGGGDGEAASAFEGRAISPVDSARRSRRGSPTRRAAVWGEGAGTEDNGFLGKKEKSVGRVDTIGGILMGSLVKVEVACRRSLPIFFVLV